MTLGLISHVAEDIGLSRASLMRISISADKRYKFFQIPKKGGGMRLIAQPAREVKAIQRSLIEVLRPLLPIHPASTAYEPGSRLLNNAIPHVDARFILKFDFSSFFPSIGEAAIDAHLRGVIGDGISDAEVRFVQNVCLMRDRTSGRRGLCIGAPSSPFLSNTVMHEFDRLLSAHCALAGVTYTRYSDDVTLSAKSPNLMGEAEAYFRQLCQTIAYPRLVINEDKRMSLSRKTAFRVTGLTLTNQGFVSVGRDRKRGVRAGLNRAIRGLLKGDDVRKLMGEIAFVLSIEPEFRAVLIRTYGERITDLLPTRFE